MRTDQLEVSRRRFMVTTGLVGGGLALGIASNVRSPLAQTLGTNIRPWVAPPGAEGVEVNQWIVIAPDDTITIRVNTVEAGNGSLTASPMMVCEELECDWSKVRSEYASASRNFAQPGVYGRITFAASLQVRSNREMLQTAGASARERLKLAAAQQWNVPVAEIEAKNSVLTHTPTGRKLRYGEVAAKAALVRLEREPAIKTPDKYTFAGKALVKRFDTPAKVNGSAVYGIDVRVPDMLYAAIRQSPVPGGVVLSYDKNAVANRPGVRAVLDIGGPARDRTSANVVRNRFASTDGVQRSRMPSAVVVVADTYWQAKSALDILPVEWNDGPGAGMSTEDFNRKTAALLDQPGHIARRAGDFAAGMRSAKKTVEGTYEVPYLEHATMEPLNATANVTADRVEVWGSIQDGDLALLTAAEEANIAPEKVFINATFLGGGFGRRYLTDDVREAVAVSKAVQRPVMVVWSREETMRQGFYRPFHAAKLRAGIGDDGMPVAWFTRVVNDSLQAKINPEAFFKNGGVDNGALGNMLNPPYALPNFLAEYHLLPTHIRVTWMRQPADGTIFMMESFVDEVATVSGRDPVEYRRTLLKNATDPGWLTVLNEVAAKSQWGKPLPQGTAQGFGIGTSAGTICAVVTEVSVGKNGDAKVNKVDIAFDSGHIINRSDVEHQLIGATVDALNRTFYSEITVRNGKIVQGNFDDYPLVRIDEMPPMSIHYGGLTGGTKWGGVGEETIGQTEAAVCNAIFRATGKRIRSLPLKNHDLSWT